MDKLIGMAADLAKTVLPVAAEMAKIILGSAAKLAGRAGKRALTSVREKGGAKAKGLLQKNRKVLGKTAAVSGCVLALSVAGLVLSRKK